MALLRIETSGIETPAPKAHRDSYASIPRFYYPKAEIDTPSSALGIQIARTRVCAKLDALILSPSEWSCLLDALRALAYDPGLSGYQKAVLRQSGAKSGIIAIDRMLEDHLALMLTRDVFTQIRGSPKLGSALTEKLEHLLPDECFLMLPSDDDERINGFTLLEYLFDIQQSLVAARHLTERLRSVDGVISEEDYASVIRELSEQAAKSHLDVEIDFLEYYQLICSRALLLPHDWKKQNGALLVDDILECELFREFFRLVHPALCALFTTDSNRFAPSVVRNIHRQYTQLDTDRNGMLSAAEMESYGKKKAFNPTHQRPTHDLTRAFIAQVFSECRTYPPDGEMDYKAYVDFTLLLANRTSVTSLRFLWSCLDFQKQGYLDKFTLDFFLRDLAAKVHAHRDEEEDDSDSEHDTAAFIKRVRTQIFDIVAPADPNRIAWRDLQRCKAGHVVARILTDYVAFSAYEDSGGKLSCRV